MNEYEDYLTNLTEFVTKQMNYTVIALTQWRGATPASQPQVDPVGPCVIKTKNKLSPHVLENLWHAHENAQNPQIFSSKYYGINYRTTNYRTTVQRKHSTRILHCTTDRSPFFSGVFEAARLSACTKMAANPATVLRLLSPHLRSANFVSASKICLFICCFHRFIRRTELTQKEEEKAPWAFLKLIRKPSKNKTSPFSVPAPHHDCPFQVKNLLGCSSDTLIDVLLCRSVPLNTFCQSGN